VVKRLQDKKTGEVFAGKFVKVSDAHVSVHGRTEINSLLPVFSS